MNSPAETTPQDETRSAFCARCGYAWYIHGSFDFDDLCDAFVAKEARVAVVRPTRDQLVEFLRDEWLSAGFASPEEVIDALISGRFVAVSDSQETPE